MIEFDNNFKKKEISDRGDLCLSCLIRKEYQNRNLKKMKKSILLSALIAVGIALSSCNKISVKPSNQITTESRNISGYSAIDVSDAMDVEISFASGVEGVIVEANSNLHQYILTDVVGGKLKIRMKNNVRIKSGASIKIYVSAITIDGIGISGASRVELADDLSGSYLDLELSGASTFQGGIYVTSFASDISGASNVEVWGTTSTGNIDLSGASNIEDQDFTIDDLDIDLSGASRATLTVNGIINVSASGASSFDYYGTGLINNLQTSGASSITKH